MINGYNVPCCFCC